ncbi:hypothetical protein CIHG_07174 [Coccidioides immitis H538.4]|uniref:Uncharacterized protein n=2 Tax=Coccidioides immitis TaxID=5501 RepID=A0A0J8UPC3_COCIT|nr:hypothetical protein CIRG_09078 [Coccidioides immitis RMSCC 2394]KMU89368.1 hypothetical protein CIHG_07174 [Coccidioides immitis H538.4]
MADLFDLYWSYEPDSNFLNGCKIQSTSKVVAGMPQEKRAIHNCQKISSPGTNWRLPSDYGFTGFMETAVDEIQEDVQITKPENQRQAQTTSQGRVLNGSLSSGKLVPQAPIA